MVPFITKYKCFVNEKESKNNAERPAVRIIINVRNKPESLARGLRNWLVT